MEKNAIYFPYIKVPESAWFTRILLYWDSVCTIVPMDFFNDPYLLGEYTRNLMEHELVKPIPPAAHIGEIPFFDSSFHDYITSPHIDLEKRRLNQKAGNTFRIHIEKMDSISKMLEDLDLAKHSERSWFEVEQNTANDYMAYLACCLGKIQDINSMPVTDNDVDLEVFQQSEQGQGLPENNLNQIRMEVIERIFPAPKRALTVQEIESFKLKYGKKLRSFRRLVEDKIVELTLYDPNMRQKKIAIFEDEIQEIVEEIDANFRENGFMDAVLGKLCPLLTSIPGAPFVIGLANAVYNAFDNKDESLFRSPLAYAAYAQIDLMSKAGRRS